MANFNPAIITEKGINLLAKVGETTIEFTRAATGDGAYTNEEVLSERTSLKAQKQEFPISSVSVLDESTVYLRFIISNSQNAVNLENGYYIKEVGIFANDPDEGEILYAITTAVTDQWDYLPKYNELMPSVITMEFYTKVNNSDKVCIKASCGAYATADDVIDIQNGMKNKVDKVEGKGLSTNDYTTEEKNKLFGIQEGAEVNVQADWNVLDSNSDTYIKNKPQTMKNPTSLNISLNGISQGAYDGSSQKNVNITAENVGADSSGTAEMKVSEHNGSEEAHTDIRKSITDLTQEKMHLKKGFYIHQADGGNNLQNGYIHFASIELLHTATAADISMPITFEVIGSDYKSPITIIVTFEPYVASSSMTVNAKLKAIYYDNNTNYVDIFAQTIYCTPPIQKNKINLYIQKKTKDTLIYITDFKSSYHNSNIISVSFTNDFLQTKPTGSAVKDAVFQLNANTLGGYSASSFLPAYSSGNKMVRANGFDVNIYDDNNEYPELDSELKIRLGRMDIIKYTNALNKNKSVGVFNRDKIEFNANNIAIKALPDNSLGDGVKGSLALSVAGIKVFDFGNEQISYIRPIGKSPSMMFKDTSTLSTPNHNIFLVNDFGGDYVDLGSNVQAPEYRMICGVNVKNAYLGEIDKSYMSLYSGGSFDLKAFKTGIAVVGDDKTTYIYSNTVKMGKVGNYFMVGATSSLYNHPDNYAYNVKFRNGKGVYLSLENEFTGGNSITINGDVKFVDENDITNFDDNVTDEDKQWLLGTSLQNILIDFHKKTALATITSDGLMSASDKDIINNSLYYNENDEVVMRPKGKIWFDDDNYSDGGERNQTTIGANRIFLESSYYEETTGGELIEEQGYHTVEINTDGIHATSHELHFDVTEYNETKGVVLSRTNFYPNNLMDLGSSNISYRWRNIYATNGTIQTSDRTKKTNINSLEAQKVQAFIHGLNPVSYKMIDGTSGRTHYGLIAQDVEELMNALNMDSSDFAGFIKSPKKTIKYEDENGTKLENPIEEVIENEYDYALRYDEFIAPLIKVVQEQQKTIENQQKEIEELKKEMKKLQEIVLKIV